MTIVVPAVEVEQLVVLVVSWWWQHEEVVGIMDVIMGTIMGIMVKG